MERLHKLTSAVSERSLHLTRRAGVLTTLLMMALLSPLTARADYTSSGAGGVTAIASSDIGTSLLGFVQNVVEFATGPFGIGVMTLITLGCVAKAAANMSRQQSMGGPVKVFGYCVLFFLVPFFVDWLGQTSGAVM